jgi:DNA-binding CsgD family transcriptional regulator
VQSSGLVSGITIPLISKPDQIGALTLLSWSAREHHQDVTQAATILGMVATQRAAAIGLTSGQTSVGSAKYRSLSPLQREILKWMASGKTNTEISLILGQTKRSIDYHVIEILKKLEVSTRTQAAAIFASV